jgi:hypothetical protein
VDGVFVVSGVWASIHGGGKGATILGQRTVPTFWNQLDEGAIMGGESAR